VSIEISGRVMKKKEREHAEFMNEGTPEKDENPAT